jgi:hypothetical protein
MRSSFDEVVLLLQAWRIAVVLALGCAGCAALPADTRPSPPAATLPQSTTTVPWPRPEVLTAATRAFECGRAAGHFEKPILTVIDYSLPSTHPRLWVIDMDGRRILFHELVAHGRNSGELRSVSFSNRAGSKMSSLGLFRAGESYRGEHGWAVRLDGLEPGFNDRARARAIVLHGADYVGPRSIAKLGYLGRSWGCPAVPREVSDHVVDRIRDGSAVFAYYPDRQWLRDSSFLRCAAAGDRRIATEGRSRGTDLHEGR